MQNKIASINLDYLPPTAEKLCLIPETAAESGYNVLCLKLIDNFPWDFDFRMKSSTSYDESSIGFLSKCCKQLNLKLEFVLPGSDDFGRLLRFNGYRKLTDFKEESLIINTEAVSFKSLIISIAEDLTALCPETSSLVIMQEGEADRYYKSTADILLNEGFYVSGIDRDTEFLTAEEFTNGADSAVLSSFSSLHNNYTGLITILSEIKLILIMSALASSSPAAGRFSLHTMLQKAREIEKQLEVDASLFRQSAKGVIDSEWIEINLKAFKLSGHEELFEVENRLRQSALLN